MKRRTLTALIAALILPLFAAAVALGAVSDRPDNLNQVPAAIVNLDEGVTMEVDGEQQEVPFGRLIAAELIAPTDTQAQADTLQWELVGESHAQEGLDDGSYYAVITIPANFSKQLATIGTENAEQATITVQSNEASSQVMGRVSKAIARAVAAQVGEELTNQMLDQIYLGFEQVATGLDEAADGAGQLRDGAGALAEGTDQAAAGANQLAANLPRLA
ncbi:MAG: YhgE/Pip family protein, partial [Bowdeniella nasicola]|nr:YhgE/Pip family protein [Bowdeniella nasicola]